MIALGGQKWSRPKKKKRERIERILTSVISVDMWDGSEVKHKGKEHRFVECVFVFVLGRKEKGRKRKKEPPKAILFETRIGQNKVNCAETPAM